MGRSEHNRPRKYKFALGSYLYFEPGKFIGRKFQSHLQDVVLQERRDLLPQAPFSDYTWGVKRKPASAWCSFCNLPILQCQGWNTGETGWQLQTPHPGSPLQPRLASPRWESSEEKSKHPLLLRAVSQPEKTKTQIAITNLLSACWNQSCSVLPCGAQPSDTDIWPEAVQLSEAGSQHHLKLNKRFPSLVPSPFIARVHSATPPLASRINNCISSRLA